MIRYKEKQYGVFQAGLRNIAGGTLHAASGVAGGALHAGRAVLQGAVPVTTGLGQVASSGVAAAGGLLGKGAMWAAAHPLIAGGLAAYGLYRLLRRRRQRREQERGYSIIEKMYSDGSLYEYAEKSFSDLSVSEQLSIPMPAPRAPREEVPRKIAKKAKRSGVVQQDSDGHWRIINMNGPEGKPIYWKPKYKSKEAAENVLKSYHSGGWNKR